MSKSSKKAPSNKAASGEEPDDTIGFAQRRRNLALEMAELLYEIYKEQNVIIEDGRNNAQQNFSN